MTKAVQKITLFPARDIPFDKLTLSQSNVPRMRRVASHPLDRFRAYVTLRDKVPSNAEFAHTFFVQPKTATPGLKLTSDAPALIEAYLERVTTLEQFMVFTVNPDHKRQVQIWDVINSSSNKEPLQIRCMVTETSMRVSDPRAIFVGDDAYEADGGTMLYDLFQGDDASWLESPALLDRLVTDKLRAEAETVEGWKWNVVAIDLPNRFSHGLQSLCGEPATMTNDEGAAHAKLLAEYQVLEEECAGQDEHFEETAVQNRAGPAQAGRG